MLTKPPLVPSKDALRVLRQLAFTGSTLAAVGVVTANYNVHRRIKLAEQRLETKKQIRALSNGNREEYMARLIEAAESGQDFSIRAMREKRTRDRRLKTSISASGGEKELRKPELGSAQLRLEQGRVYLDGDRTTERIRSATMSMTSTAPMHVYGQPKTYRRSTPIGPIVESQESQAPKRPTLLTKTNAVQGYREEAAEKIKRATMAMASTAPAHVYSRPKRSVPVGRLNLHCTVASWLGTASDAQTTSDAALLTGDPLSAGDSGEVVSQQGYPAGFLHKQAAQHAARKPSGYAQKSAGENESGPNDHAFAGDVVATPITQCSEEGIMRKSSQTSSGEGPSSHPGDSPDQRSNMKSGGQCMPLSGSVVRPGLVARSSSTFDVTNTKAYTTSAKSGSHGSPDPNPEKPRSYSLPTDHETLYFDTMVSTNSTEACQAEGSLSSQHRSSTDLKGNTNAADPNDGSTQEEGFSKLNIPISHPRLASQAVHGIHLQHTTKEAQQPEFIPWPNLQPADDLLSLEEQEESFWSLDDRIADYERQVFKCDAYAQSEGARGQQAETKQNWTPFPKTFPSLRNGRHDHRKQPQDEPRKTKQIWTPFPRSFQPTRHDSSAQFEQPSDEEHVTTQSWTPFPRFAELQEAIVDPGDLEENPVPKHASWSQYPQRELRESEDFVDKTVRQASAMPIMTAEERVALIFHIQNVFSLDGRAEGRRAWKIAAELRLHHNDLATLDFLYAEFVEKGIMKVSPRYYVVQSLIQWHYKISKHSARAAEILFPNVQPDLAGSFRPNFAYSTALVSLFKKDKATSAFALRFIQGVWERRADTNWLMFNLRRVIVASKLQGARLVEDVFALAIRCLASIGDMATAQAVYDEMVFYHQIEATFLSRTLLLRGYARISDWARVEREIEALHNLGLSRGRPHGYALMVNAVLQEYAARSSIEHFQDFLINAISYYGLIPTSAVSATVVQTYVSKQRFDLVQEWMETLQVLFPKITTETSTFQWLLGNFWQRSRANCQEIERVIKAVSHRNPYSKLKSYSLSMVHEALSRDLAAKLDVVKAKTDPSNQTTGSVADDANDFISTQTLDEYITAAFSLTSSIISQNQKPTPEVVDLLRQVTAVQRVNALLMNTTFPKAVNESSFSTFDSGTADFYHNTSFYTTNSPLTRTKSSLSHLEDTIPTILTSEFLPEASLITSAMLDFYRTRFIYDLPTDHTLLLWIFDKLIHADRLFDATNLLNRMYRNAMLRKLTGLHDHDEDDELWGRNMRSAGTDDELAGTGRTLHPDRIVRFPIDLYDVWMRLAGLTRSLIQWITVVEEVLRLSYPYPVPYPSSSSASSSPNETLSPTRQGLLSPHRLKPLNITSAFLFLTRTMAMRLLKGRFVRWNPRDRRGPVHEIEWLVRELEIRREVQIGRPEERFWGKKGWRVGGRLV